MSKPNRWKHKLAVLVVLAAVSSSAQVFTSLVTFNYQDGATPVDESLVQGPDGKLYGTTEEGGFVISTRCFYGCGTIFRIDEDGRLTTLHLFCADNPTACPDGFYPADGLVLGDNGSLYGTTYYGGSTSGTAFEIPTNGVLTTVANFGATLGHPLGGLLLASDGNFYGTSAVGGVHGGGTVFKLTPEGDLTLIYSFCSQSECTDGDDPSGYLVQAPDGSIYGTTVQGGLRNSECSYGCGLIFKVGRVGTLTTVHEFDNSDGASAELLTLGVDGKLYGLTAVGGNYLSGTIFSLTTEGVFTSLYSFCSQLNSGGYCSDGGGPVGSLVQSAGGSFYGATYGGGANGLGTLFEYTLPASLATLHSFNGADGELPNGGLMQATNGVFYGTTEYGGDLNCGITYGCGTVFSLSVGLGPFVKTVPIAAKVGTGVGILGTDLDGATGVAFNGTPAQFTVKSPMLILTDVPTGATTGYVTVTTGSVLKSKVPFHVIP